MLSVANTMNGAAVVNKVTPSNPSSVSLLSVSNRQEAAFGHVLKAFVDLGGGGCLPAVLLAHQIERLVNISVTDEAVGCVA